MTISLPSKPITFVDVPEIKKLNGTFVYNFFVSDEGVNETGLFLHNSSNKSVLNFDLVSFNELDKNKFIPRYIKFSFSPIFFPQKKIGNEFLNKSDKQIPKIKNKLSKIISEEEFSDYNFIGIGFQDSKLDGKLYFLASGTLSSRLNGNGSFGSNSADIKSQGDLSFLELAKILNDLTPSDIEGETIVDAISQNKAKNISFTNKQNREILNDTFDDIKNLSIKMIMNSSLSHTMIRNTINDGTSIYSDELIPLLKETKNFQEQAIINSNTKGISSNDYITAPKFIELIAKGGENIVHTSRILGYIIDKYEIKSDGSYLLKEPIVLEGPNSSQAIDFKVKYGSTYSYSIKTIAEATFTAIDDESDDISVVKVFLSSRPSSRLEIACTEDVPPPPPADFNIMWDYKFNKPRLIWNFPPNSQRDIRKFQIFKRNTINEPFELIQMFDFNDSKLLIDNFEKIDNKLIQKSKEPVLYYLDEEFKKDSKAIYAICSVDAHGISSNYSMQFEVYFDRFKNKIIKNMISVSGAPKSYPNMYLSNPNVFVDTMLDSGHSHLKIVFNPEFLKITDTDNNDLNYLATDKSKGKYKFQFINVDLQKMKNLEIELRDKQSLENNNPILLPNQNKPGSIFVVK